MRPERSRQAWSISSAPLRASIVQFANFTAHFEKFGHTSVSELRSIYARAYIEVPAWVFWTLSLYAPLPYTLHFQSSSVRELARKASSTRTAANATRFDAVMSFVSNHPW